MDKIATRKMLQEQRRLLLPEEREACSQAIREKVRARPEFKRARMVAFYYPVRGEVDLLPLAWTLAGTDKLPLFPRVEGSNLVFCPVEGEKDLGTGYKGIPEPVTTPVPLDRIDLFLVPAVAYDLEGYRLGMGGGFYDRVLSRKGSWQTALGVAFDFQVVECLPRDWWDRRVDLIITENRMLTPTTTWHLKRR